MTATIDLAGVLAAYVTRNEFQNSLTAEADARAKDLATEAKRSTDALGQEANDRIRAITQEGEDRGLADAEEAKARKAGDDAEADARRTDVAALGEMVRSAFVAILQPNRPGISPAAFAGSASGPIAQTVPLDPAGVGASPLGLVYRITGAGLVAPRATVAVDPDAIWVLRARFWRLSDVNDPNNATVHIGIQWLDGAGAGVGYSIVHRELDLKVQDGPKSVAVRVPSMVGEAGRIAAPPGAVAWRPFIQTYGADGATGVEVLGASDASFAGVYAPDVAAIAADLRTIQAQIAAGLPFSTPILPSYAVADLPKPGNPGRKAFARDGRAPNAAGALEGANAGTGVEVTDNGTKWVITGTNQQVQA